ncbi:MAG: 1-acyl-sn-glycerol-3-phosphate acyltransferase [Bacteroidales bacterium]|nr:1-acyl-sn-glycerol-3-phosphate acyltransferase [Bacteroidales bacterium]
MLTRLFIKLYRYLSKRKALRLSLMILVCALATVGALQLNFREDISDFLPQKSGYSKVSNFIGIAAGNSRIFIFINQKDSVYRPDTLAHRMDAFANYLKKTGSPLVADIEPRTNDNAINTTAKFVQENIPLFIDSSRYRFAADSCLTPQHAEKALQTDKTILQSPTPGYVKNVVQSDPLGLFVNVLSDLQSFKPASGYTLYNGYIMEPEMKRGVIFFDSPTGMSESGVNAQIVELMQNAANKFQNLYPDTEVNIFGPPVIAVCNAAQIKKDSLITSVLSIVLILIILWFSIRNIRNLLVMGITLAFGFAVAAAMSWIMFGGISIIALGICAVFTGIAANYPLHFITHYYHTDNMEQNIREIASPLITGNVTTVAAFLALIFADSPALRDLGFAGGILLIAAILFTLIFCPHLVQKIDTNRLSSKCGMNLSFNFLQKKYVIIPVLVVTPVLVWLGTKTQFDGEMSRLNYMTPSLRAEAAHTFGMMNSDSAISVYVATTGNNIEEALQRYEKAAPIADSLLKTNMIQKVSGIGNFLPSKKLQQHRINLWNSFTNTYRDSILNLIEFHAEQQKVNKNYFHKAEKILKDTFEVKDYAFFEPLLNTGAGGYITLDSSCSAVITILRVKPELAKQVTECFAGLDPDISAFDERIVSQTLTESLSDNFNFVLFSAGFIVFIFLTISFGRAELSVISFIPLTVSWFWILGIMYLTGISFNIVNIILATFIFGQGDDYTVFITEGLIYEHSRGRKVLDSFKNSVAISSLIMFVGIGSLIFAQHPAMKSLGVVVVIGMFSVVAAAYIFPPMLYNFLVKERDGSPRQFPYTFRSMAGSLFYFLRFLWICFWMRMYTIFVKNREKIHFKMYQYVQMIYDAPRVKFEVNNPYGEDFSKPCLIIANHQSSFDILAIKSLSHKILFLTNDAQQKNFIYGSFLKKVDFHPSSLGYDVLVEKFKPLVAQGYSIVVFPEGTRSTNGTIHRFHQGAFYLAKQLELDIVPIVLLGLNLVFKKGGLIVNPGKMVLEIGKRAGADNPLCAETTLETARNFRHYIIDYMEGMRKQHQNKDYYLPLVYHNYLYKGSEIANTVKKSLNGDLSFIDSFTGNTKVFNNCGYGEIALLFALVHPETEVTAYDPDPDKILVAKNCVSVPANLKYSSQICDTL